MVRIEMDEAARRNYLVQVPTARGRLIPDIDSINDDFPALWEPMTTIMGKSTSAPTLSGMKTCHNDGIDDLTYPVARMRSTTSRILRLYALWVGSDRPTPRCSDELDGDNIDGVSGVVAKESIEEIEDTLLMWGLEDI